MPLQNRCDPFGDLFTSKARGLFMGNRGGRIHDDARRLTARCWASMQWICCRLVFNGRRRGVWGDGYTELFFLDEVTALAAGHRPCFECRRADANDFADAWGRACGHRPRAAEMDAVLHGERLAGGKKRRHRREVADLPDGSTIAIGDDAYAVRGDMLLRWSPAGYGERLLRPARADADLLTPPSIVAVLAAGYRPHWHPSADRAAN
ncbi:hypothetical protein [Pseudorhodoplanes sp.]|uniref:hypothetical protein n=1 Tax=Pseudorhodoplanes sp. TaxID=1934341 RepID=UPI00391AC7D0